MVHLSQRRENNTLESSLLINSFKTSPAWKTLDEWAFHPLKVDTPLVRSVALAQTSGIEQVFFKAEYLQAGNSFKVRGALHKLRALLSQDKRPTVFTASAGNHGIGLALAADALGFQAVIYAPTTTPEVKKRKILDIGAHLEIAGEDFDSCELLAKQACERNDGEYVSSFDDDYIIAGNGGSMAREIEDGFSGDIDGLDIVVPIGGGGMAAGLAAHFYQKNVRVIGVEPANNCAMTMSMTDGAYKENYSGTGSYADGLAGAISQRTFGLCQSGLDRVLTVSETDILQSIRWAYENLGIAIEGSAAVAIAALFNNAPALSSRVCLILSGSNIDQTLISKACSSH
ncbi:TPA: pyridoxal-phosphate dependent enzyme [Pseudomonas aeruginosa]|nr:pyridoxal-phosphate dependent enzyme [Pseudomonas aeruginosa]